jgi:hypothetical protein
MSWKFSAGREKVFAACNAVKEHTEFSFHWIIIKMYVWLFSAVFWGPE